MEVTFRTVSGSVYKIPVELQMNIGECKNIIREKAGIPEGETIKMILKAKVLEDSTTIESMNLQPRDFIIVHVQTAKKAAPAPAPVPPTPVAPVAPAPVAPVPVAPAPVIPPRPAPVIPEPGRRTGPVSEPLPEIPQTAPRGDQAVDENSPEFLAAIDQLVEIGYPKTDCVAALKAAMGDPNMAAHFLETGELPSDEDQRAFRQNQDSIRQMRTILESQPDKLIDIIQLIESNSPESGIIFRAHPELLLEHLRLDPSKFDLASIKSTAPPGVPSLEEIRMGGQPRNAPQTRPQNPRSPPPADPMSGIMSQFSEAEKESITRLVELGFDKGTVIQVFLACDKNENIAANCLLGMN